MAVRTVHAQRGILSASWRAAPEATDGIYFDVCALGLWSAFHADAEGATRAVALLHRAPDPLRSTQTVYISLCTHLLEAQVAAALGRPDAPARLEALDSLARTAPPAITWLLAGANLTAARLWEQKGDLERALTAVRRRLYITEFDEPRVLVAHSTTLREEGRLALLVGDTAAAIQAWRRYLALYATPEPAVAAEAARIRAEFDRLTESASRSKK